MNRNQLWEGLLWWLSPFVRSMKWLGENVSLIISYLVQVLLAGLFAFALHTFFGWNLAAIMLGIIMVFILNGWTPWFNVWFCMLRFNYAAVYENILTGREKFDRNLDREALLTVRPSRTCTAVVGPKIIGINPLKLLVRDKAINLARAQVLGSDKLELYTKNNELILADWKIFVTALKDQLGLLCLIQHTDEYVDQFLTLEAKAFLQRTARTMSLTEIFAGLDTDANGNAVLPPGTNPASITSRQTLENKFAAFLSGKLNLHPIEIALGRYTDEPKLTITLSPQLIASLQAKAIADGTTAALKSYTSAENGSMNVEVAANLIAAQQGLEMPVEIIRAPEGLYLVRETGGGGRRRQN